MTTYFLFLSLLPCADKTSLTCQLFHTLWQGTDGQTTIFLSILILHAQNDVWPCSFFQSGERTDKRIGRTPYRCAFVLWTLVLVRFRRLGATQATAVATMAHQWNKGLLRRLLLPRLLKLVSLRTHSRFRFAPQSAPRVQLLWEAYSAVLPVGGRSRTIHTLYQWICAISAASEANANIQ